jgi:hypothetical protein
MIYLLFIMVRPCSLNKLYVIDQLFRTIIISIISYARLLTVKFENVESSKR